MVWQAAEQSEARLPARGGVRSAPNSIQFDEKLKIYYLNKIFSKDND
jgi:hypothetical protein